LKSGGEMCEVFILPDFADGRQSASVWRATLVREGGGWTSLDRGFKAE
jgi:hypothetical protein